MSASRSPSKEKTNESGGEHEPDCARGDHREREQRAPAVAAEVAQREKRAVSRAPGRPSFVGRDAAVPRASPPAARRRGSRGRGWREAPRCRARDGAGGRAPRCRRRCRNRGCRWVRRRATLAARGPGRGRSPRVGARHPRAGPVDGRGGPRVRPIRGPPRLAGGRRAAGTASIHSGYSTFSSAESTGRRLKVWKTKPRARRRSSVRSRASSNARSAPAMHSSPASGWSIVPNRLSRVLLPLPDGPAMTSISPAATSRSTPRNAGTSVWPRRKDLRSPRARNSGVEESSKEGRKRRDSNGGPRGGFGAL